MRKLRKSLLPLMLIFALLLSACGGTASSDNARADNSSGTAEAAKPAETEFDAGPGQASKSADEMAGTEEPGQIAEPSRTAGLGQTVSGQAAEPGQAADQGQAAGQGQTADQGQAAGQGRTAGQGQAAEPGQAAGQGEAGNTGESPSAPSSFSLSDIPAYSGSPYVAVNGNEPYFTSSDLTTSAFETYSDLDSLGRCGTAYANVCTEIMPTEERGSIGSVKPTGWQTVKYSGLVDGNYLYNRCHLIGYQLAGENANEKNLITGTRYLNVEGMLPFENLVADYVEETDNHVLYRVTPIFDGNNLVASGVLMEAMSVEDNGDGILFGVYCYNVQPGIGIDYANGDSWLEDGGDAELEVAAVAEPEASKSAADKSAADKSAVDEPEAAQGGGITYILNTSTKKFHYPSCSSVKQMNDENKQEYTGMRDDVMAMGYDPCGRCNP